ncbi:MAG: cysteine dioxygenase family protein [Nitrospinota bacterium]|nr:cysteine dioxygenase family protein [Nitrospinota bacterium]
MSKYMQNFIKEVQVLVDEIQDEVALTSKISIGMEPILKDPLLLTDEQLLVKKNGFTLNCVHIAPDESFSIGVGIWDIGQTTPIHDHGTWGVIGIYKGIEKEESFSNLGTRENGSKVTMSPLGNRLAKPGDTFVCCTKDTDLHRVSCASDEPVVGIHVYGGDLAKIPRFKYDEVSGKVSSFKTGWDYAKAG